MNQPMNAGEIAKALEDHERSLGEARSRLADALDHVGTALETVAQIDREDEDVPRGLGVWPSLEFLTEDQKLLVTELASASARIVHVRRLLADLHDNGELFVLRRAIRQLGNVDNVRPLRAAEGK